MAGVAGLTFSNKINGCDSKSVKMYPSETAGNPRECRTMTSHRETRGMLRKVRDAHGAESEIGHLCSDIMEASENFDKSTDEEQRRHLTASIVRWMADLDAKLSQSR